MPRTPDSRDGPLFESEVRFEEQTSDPTENLGMRYVQDKGLVILEDGVTRAIGESRDATWQKTALDKDLTAPPGGETAGDRYVVGSSATGAWAGHDGEIAQWDGSAYVFTTPKQGTIVYLLDENEQYKQTQSSTPWAWVQVDTTAGGGLPPATEVGQMLFSFNGTTFEIVKPLVSDDGFIVTDDDGHIVVTETP